MDINAIDELDLRIDNPYSLGNVFTLGSEIMLERDAITHLKSPLDRQYEVTGSEKLSDIAFEAYGNSKYWWIIYDTNDIDNPFDLEPGVILLIPDLDTVTLKLLD